MIDIFQNIRKVTPAPGVIMLTNKVRGLYQRKGLSLKMDFLLDKFTELNKIPDLLHRLAMSRRTKKWKLFQGVNTWIELPLRQQVVIDV